MGFEVDNNGRSFYQPNTFYINFNPSYLNNDGNPNPDSLPVFFHEYAHLIQDTATIFGINSFLSFHDIIQEVFRVTSISTEIKLPVSDRSSWMSFLYEYNKCIYPTNSWPSQVLWAFDSFYIDEVAINCNNDQYDVPVIKARFVDNTGTYSPIEHEIGVREIKESYSMAVQNMHSEIDYDYNLLNEFQYAAIERVLLKKFSRIDNKCVITICHWSLNSLHPAIELFEIIQEIEYESIELTWKSLYTFLRRRFSQKNNSIISTIKENYSKLLLNQKRGGDRDMLYTTYEWYSNNILKNLDLIIDERSFFPIDTVLCDPEKDINSFMENFPIWLYESGGTVGYTNAKIEQKSDFVYFFRSIASVIYNLKGKSTTWSCILYEVCNEVNECCSSEPWKRWHTNPPCNYCAACYYLNLKPNSVLIS